LIALRPSEQWPGAAISFRILVEWLLRRIEAAFADRRLFKRALIEDCILDLGPCGLRHRRMMRRLGLPDGVELLP
jgi:hypothetical protein